MFRVPQTPPLALRHVRKINKTWIVRGTLKQHADEFLTHLESEQSNRLAFACDLTLRVLDASHHHARWGILDPKAYFYPALFSVGTPLEWARWLPAHAFTHACVRAVHQSKRSRWTHDDWLQGINRRTQHKLFMVASLIRRHSVTSGLPITQVPEQQLLQGF
jgi:hypothetical protein